MIGTDINTIILTTPSPTWILSKIAGMPGTLRTKIVKRDGGIGDNPTRLYSRLALTYEPWYSPDLKKHGVNKRFKDNFSCCAHARAISEPNLYERIRYTYIHSLIID